MFGAGIEKHQTARRQAAEAAAAEAAKKPSLMGKAKGVFGTSNKSSGGGAGLPPVAPNGVGESRSCADVVGLCQYSTAALALHLETNTSKACSRVHAATRMPGCTCVVLTAEARFDC